MSLTFDDRGRVPFALIAAVLLIASATLAASVRMHDTEPPDPDVPAALDRGTASTESSVAAAVDRAARAAARDPVIDPADTPFGRVIDPATPFRDSLRIRIYLAVTRNLGIVRERVGDVTTTASIPPIRNVSTLQEAMERVDVSSVNQSLQVTVRNITVTARRNGRVVTRETRTVTVTVATPVLTLHERATHYDDMLDRGPLAGDGVGQLLTAYLYAMTWARGYLQYGGFPIANVVANRHVELFTNTAMLNLQRSAFGTTDSDGRAALARAMAMVSIHDLAAAMNEANVSGAPARITSILVGSDPSRPAGIPATPGGGPSTPDPADLMAIGVNGTADTAFVWLLSGVDGPSLDELIRRTYAARGTVAANVVAVTPGNKPEPNPPSGGGWTLASENVETTARVTEGGAPLPRNRSDRTRHASYTRRVERTHVVTYRWERGRNTTTTTASWRDEYRVGLAVDVTHVPAEHVPENPIRHLHEPGGPLSGQNLAGVPSELKQRLVTDRGGPDELARRAVAGELSTDPVTVRGDRPAELRQWIYEDLATLRERLSNITTNVSRGRLGTGATPSAALAATVTERRDALVDAPPQYRSVADKVRVVARAAYVDRVIAALRARTAAERGTNAGIGNALDEVANVSLPQVEQSRQSRRETVRAGTVSGPDGPMNLTVDTAPSYLALSTVDHDRVPAVDPATTFRPLAAQNINLFTVPYGDVADTAIGSISGGTDTVSLRTAALALKSANRTLEDGPDPRLERRRKDLRIAVQLAVKQAVFHGSNGVMNATDFSRAASRAMVREAVNNWNSTDARALAITNGSVARAVRSIAQSRASIDEPTADEIAVRVRIALQAARLRESVRVDVADVEPVTKTVREAGLQAVGSTLKNELSELSQEAIQDRLSDADWVEENFESDDLDSVPAGLPMIPVPGYWYATVNLWYVHVRGAYARFTLRAPRGSPVDGMGAVQYTRDGDAVRLDVDGDDNRELLGWATRVSVDVNTTVAIAVPSGRPEGVGDVDGNMDERSEGWPSVGPFRSENRSVDSVTPIPGGGSGNGSGSATGPRPPRPSMAGKHPGRRTTTTSGTLPATTEPPESIGTIASRCPGRVCSTMNADRFRNPSRTSARSTPRTWRRPSIESALRRRSNGPE